jgi:hypothetical protein
MILAISSGVLVSMMGLVLHLAASNMHALAVEQYWAQGGDLQRFKWSHAYCRMMGAPLRRSFEKF